VETRTLVTKLPVDLVEILDTICKRLRLQKSLFVEEAIREKIEDLLDAEDLRDAMKEATRFHAWEEVKAEARKEGRRSPTRSKSRAERDETT
jgi:predicted DNA-binding protein